jgi:3',5'-nucleoside bisphosphate phosphatase
MSKVDLHIHTNYSDGRDTVSEVLEMARENGLETIAITDHDTILGVEEAVKIGREKGVKVIPAVEISINYQKKLIHILGYNLDYKNEKIELFFERLNDLKRNHFVSELKRLNSELKKTTGKEADLEKFSASEYLCFSYPGLANFLTQEGIFEKSEESFEFLKDRLIKPSDLIDSEETIAVIHELGGKAVLAHPFAPRVSLKKLADNRKEFEMIIEDFIKQGLDGIECYQAGHSEGETQMALELAKKYNLMATGGSDWHGSFEKLGGKSILAYTPFYPKKLGDLFVPDEIGEI